ncbi:hypothetical protein APUTEX25_001025, partial [Auxenochlorella protothecoides]
MALLALATRTGLRRLMPEVRALAQGAHLRFFAEAAAQEREEDPILTLFRENQRQFREFLKGLQGIPFPLSGEKTAVAQYKDRVEALRSEVGARTVEDAVREELAAAAARQPASLAELTAALSASSDPAAVAAHDALVAWAQDVSDWLEDFEDRRGDDLPDAAATAAVEAELASGRLLSGPDARSDVHPAESEFWTKAAEWEAGLERVGALLAALPEVPITDARVAELVTGEYQALVDQARTVVADELAKADDLTGAGTGGLPEEIKPKLA